MKTALLSFLLLLYVPLANPALAKPRGNSTVVGCLVVEIFGSYPKEPGPVSFEQEIRISCLYHDKKGRENEAFFHTKTDTAGYFRLDRVPAGKYVLKAVDFKFERASHITLASRFGRSTFGEEGRYWGMINGMMMDNMRDLLSDHIDVPPDSGVIDLGISFIQIRADISSTDSGMGKSSPDGKPPWLRINMMDRGSNIDLFLVNSRTFPEMVNIKSNQTTAVYNRVSPTSYFGLQ